MSTQKLSIPQYGVTPQIKKLHSMIGEWDVLFDGRGGPEEPFQSYQITSTITSLLDGTFLQEKISMPASSSESVDLIGILGYDRYREVFRFAWLDNKYAIFDVHEGNWEDDALIVNNLRSATTFQLQNIEIFSQMIWREITSNGFLMEADASLDGGKTWFAQAKARYVRKSN